MTLELDTDRAARRDALADQVFRSVIGAQETIHIYLGHKLNLYRALATVDNATGAELADRAGISPRYAREWLEQQAVAGLLDVAEDTGDAASRRFQLPPGGAEVLCDPESLYYVAPLTGLVQGIAEAVPEVLTAFRTGGGVPYAAYGTDLREGIADVNRPAFSHLVGDWVAGLPDIDARLLATDPPGRIADLGCGSGWSTIALARAYPGAQVDGVDLDEASVADARRNAAAAGLTERVSFSNEDAADARTSRYDLVTFFETLHDMAYPVDALRAAYHMLAPGGAVLIGDEKVAERFTAPGDEMERFHYGWSAIHCLAAALAEPDSAATGTAMRPDTVRRYAAAAGFSSVTVLPIEYDFWRFYRLDP
ncbi:MAG: class I SAM-dependent methyltransferase [Micromonosporaceae bacterium]